MADDNGAVWNPDVLEIVPEMDFSGMMNGPYGQVIREGAHLCRVSGTFFNPYDEYSPTLVRDFYKALISARNLPVNGFEIRMRGNYIPIDDRTLCLVFGFPSPIRTRYPERYEIDNDARILYHYLNVFGHTPCMPITGIQNLSITVSLPANIATFAIWVMRNLLGYKDLHLVNNEVMHTVWSIIHKRIGIDISKKMLVGIRSVYNMRKPVLSYPVSICKMLLYDFPHWRAYYSDWVPIKPIDPTFWAIRRSRQLTWSPTQVPLHIPPCHKNDDFLNTIEDDRLREVLTCVFAWRDRFDGYRN
jgi:hypothetical protein